MNADDRRLQALLEEALDILLDQQGGFFLGTPAELQGMFEVMREVHREIGDRMTAEARFAHERAAERAA